MSEAIVANSGLVPYIACANAGIAQLVERNLAKVDVAGSNPVSRSALRGRGWSVIAPNVSVNTLPLVSGPAAPNPTRWRGSYFILRGELSPEEPAFTATYPSGKGEVCKTFMHRFESGRRLQWNRRCRRKSRGPLDQGSRLCVLRALHYSGKHRILSHLREPQRPGWRNW